MPGQQRHVAEVVGDRPGALIDRRDLGPLHFDHAVRERVAEAVEQPRRANRHRLLRRRVRGPPAGLAGAAGAAPARRHRPLGAAPCPAATSATIDDHGTARQATTTDRARTLISTSTLRTGVDPTRRAS